MNNESIEEDAAVEFDKTVVEVKKLRGIRAYITLAVAVEEDASGTSKGVIAQCGDAHDILKLLNIARDTVFRNMMLKPCCESTGLYYDSKTNEQTEENNHE